MYEGLPDSSQVLKSKRLRFLPYTGYRFPVTGCLFFHLSLVTSYLLITQSGRSSSRFSFCISATAVSFESYACRAT